MRSYRIAGVKKSHGSPLLSVGAAVYRVIRVNSILSHVNFSQFSHYSSMDDLSSTLDSLLLSDTSQSSSIDSNVFETSNEDMTSRDEQEDMTSNAETTNTNDPTSSDEDLLPPSTPRNIDSTFHQPLYDGAKLTVFDSYLSLMQYSLRHGLTKQAFIDLLGLVGRHIPTNSIVFLYKLRKFFQGTCGDVSFKIHYCCSGCHAPLCNLESTCPNGCDQAVALEFLVVPIENQLKRQLEGIYVVCKIHILGTLQSNCYNL